ncbi:GAF and ANTAR domain-containing protein [Nocardioides pocheonensis]|jgi:AmiR/NasT family two-component response regulator|nr:GAF and ANTAR domain-containing protein [Nocardioides pocheonensis]
MEEPLARACSELARTMARPGALIEVMQDLALRTSEVLGIPAAAVVLTDSAGTLRPVAATDAPGAGMVTTEMKLDEGPTIDALREGAVVFADDLEADERWPRYVERARSAGVEGVLAVPLRLGERPAGVLTVVASEPHRWHLTEVAAAEVLADLAAGYAAHESALDHVRRTAEQLQEALESRVDIEQAKGVLVGELGCTIDQAYAMLRDHARRNNASLRSVAQAVVHLGLRPPATSRRGARPTSRIRPVPPDQRTEGA